jgi:Spy/CpxP family protein refolding chaperone
MSKVTGPVSPGEMLDISFTMGFTDFASVRRAPEGGQAAAGDPPACQQEWIMKLSSLFCVLILVLCAVSEGHAQGAGRDNRPDPPGAAGREVSLVKELKLTEAQDRETRRIRTLYSNRILKLRSEIIGKSIQYRELLSDPAATEESIRAKGREIEAIDTQLIRERIDFEIEMRKILTPEQFHRWYSSMDQPPAKKKTVR